MFSKNKNNSNSNDFIDDDIDYLDDEPKNKDETKNNDDEDFFNEDLDFSDNNDFIGDDSASAMDKHNDLLKELTDFKPFFKEFSIRVLGLKWDYTKKEYVRNPAVEPIANEKFVNWAMTQFGCYLRKNNIITNIGLDEYKYLMTDISKVIILNIGTRMEEFGIKHNGDYMALSNHMIHSIELVLMGAGDGKYNNLLTSVTHRTENVQVNDGYNNRHKPGKKGILDNLKSGMFGG